MEKTKFFVINENIFGCVNPIQPNYLTVLASSIIRGATHTWKDGSYLLSMATTIRPATLKDFDVYRVSHEGYQRDTEHYSFPKE